MKGLHGGPAGQVLPRLGSAEEGPEELADGPEVEKAIARPEQVGPNTWVEEEQEELENGPETSAPAYLRITKAGADIPDFGRDDQAAPDPVSIRGLRLHGPTEECIQQEPWEIDASVERVM